MRKRLQHYAEYHILRVELHSIASMRSAVFFPFNTFDINRREANVPGVHLESGLLAFQQVLASAVQVYMPWLLLGKRQRLVSSLYAFLSAKPKALMLSQKQPLKAHPRPRQ